MEKKSKERDDILAGLSEHDRGLFGDKLDLKRLLARLEKSTGPNADKIQKQVEETQLNIKEIEEISGYEDSAAIDRYLILGVECQELGEQFSQAYAKEQSLAQEKFKEHKADVLAHLKGLLDQSYNKVSDLLHSSGADGLQTNYGLSYEASLDKISFNDACEIRRSEELIKLLEMFLQDENKRGGDSAHFDYMVHKLKEQLKPLKINFPF